MRVGAGLWNLLRNMMEKTTYILKDSIIQKFDESSNCGKVHYYHDWEGNIESWGATSVKFQYYHVSCDAPAQAYHVRFSFTIHICRITIVDRIVTWATFTAGIDIEYLFLLWAVSKNCTNILYLSYWFAGFMLESELFFLFTRKIMSTFSGNMHLFLIQLNLS